MRQPVVGALLAVLAHGVAAQTTAPAPASAVPLYHNLGTLTHRISTPVPAAQRYFDQGLRLTYGFNHAEAIRAYREAARLDSTCAICWWGVALAYGPNINLPMDSAAGVAAWEALQRAVALRAGASPAEQAYIDALTARYGPDPVAARAQRDSAYARAMGDVARRYPNDADAATLHAEALMDLRPWNFYAADGSAYAGVSEIVSTLEGVLRRTPSHPGACHYYIHAVEASPRPERALPCARRLASLMPGAGHIVHMPAHVYIRLGMYAQAERANVHAAHTDESYIADQHPDGIYPLGYYPHNLHFLWAAAALAGRQADAADALRRLGAAAPDETVRQIPVLQFFTVPRYLNLVWFGKWDDALAAAPPPADLRYSVGVWHYARGRALAATGRGAEARVELDSVRAIRASRPADELVSTLATSGALLAVAEHLLAGEIAVRERRWDEAVTHLTEAVRSQDALPYNEPADWYPSARLSLGAALLQAGRAPEAEAVFRDDLRRNPGNGWSLFGLAQVLEREGKRALAAQARARFERAFAGADVSLTESRF